MKVTFGSTASSMVQTGPDAKFPLFSDLSGVTADPLPLRPGESIMVPVDGSPDIRFAFSADGGGAVLPVARVDSVSIPSTVKKGGARHRVNVTTSPNVFATAFTDAASTPTRHCASRSGRRPLGSDGAAGATRTATRARNPLLDTTGKLFRALTHIRIRPA